MSLSSEASSLGSRASSPPPEDLFEKWMDTVYSKLCSRMGRRKSSASIVVPPASSSSDRRRIQLPSAAQNLKSRGMVSVGCLRQYLLDIGLSKTPQMSIANDTILLQVLKDFDARAFQRDTLSVAILKVGRKFFPCDPLEPPASSSRTLKRTLLEHYAEPEFRPDQNEHDDSDGRLSRIDEDHKSYESALHEVYEYELGFRKLFSDFAHWHNNETNSELAPQEAAGSDTEIRSKRHISPNYQHHHRRHSHAKTHFSRMSEEQFKHFFVSCSLVPNLVDMHTCIEVFNTQHTDELAFDPYMSSMAHLALVAFSASEQGKSIDVGGNNNHKKSMTKRGTHWLVGKSGAQKVHLLVQFMNRHLSKVEQRLVRDDTLEHKHNRQVLNLAPTMVEMFADAQLRDACAWLGVPSDSDDSDNYSDDGLKDMDVEKDERQRRASRRKRLRARKLRLSQPFPAAKAPPATVNLMRNFLEVSKRMTDMVTNLRRERMLSLILHRWQKYVWHCKFRRMTEQGRMEHRSQALVHLAHCASSWKKRVLTHALSEWKRKTKLFYSLKRMQERSERKRINLLIRKILSRWAQVAHAEVKQQRILRNFVMRWNNLELHRWFNAWCHETSRVTRILRGVKRMQCRFMYRCFYYWQQYATDTMHRRDLAETKGVARRFEMLQNTWKIWSYWALSQTQARNAIYGMAIRRHHRVKRRVLTAWLSYFGKEIEISRRAPIVSKIVFGETRKKRIQLLTLRSSEAHLAYYFHHWKEISENSERRKGLKSQANKIQAFMMKKYRRKELRFNFTQWLHWFQHHRSIRMKVANMLLRHQHEKQKYVFQNWKDSVDSKKQEQLIMRTFVSRIMNRGLALTFNTWKVSFTTHQKSNFPPPSTALAHALNTLIYYTEFVHLRAIFLLASFTAFFQEHASDRIWLRSRVQTTLKRWKNRTILNCITAWKRLVDELHQIRNQVDSIDRYLLLGKSISAWRQLVIRRGINIRISSLLSRNRDWRCKRRCFQAWAHAHGYVALYGPRRKILLGAMRRWCDSVSRQRTAVVAWRRSQRNEKAWTKKAISPYCEKIRRLEFELAQLSHLKQSDRKERNMLHSYMSHSVQRDAFTLDVIQQLRAKFT